jgi:Beta/Gamma crystallin
MAEQPDDCYIDVWREADFGGEMLRIRGPADYPALEFEQGDWGDRIGSLRVGPGAFVIAYRSRDFRDEPVTFGPDDECADLRQFKCDDDIESVKVIDSMKIFARVEYNADLTPKAPDTPTPAGGGPPGPDKGKRRKGRKR